MITTMPRPSAGFGTRNRCPDCKQNVDRSVGYRRVGPWNVHQKCTVTCVLCNQEIVAPPIGQAHTVAAWCGEPCHATCKEDR